MQTELGHSADCLGEFVDLLSLSPSLPLSLSPPLSPCPVCHFPKRREAARGGFEAFQCLRRRKGRVLIHSMVINLLGS
jgi:hypothetical protein